MDSKVLYNFSKLKEDRRRYTYSGLMTQRCRLGKTSFADEQARDYLKTASYKRREGVKKKSDIPFVISQVACSPDYFHKQETKKTTCLEKLESSKDKQSIYLPKLDLDKKSNMIGLKNQHSASYSGHKALNSPSRPKFRVEQVKERELKKKNAERQLAKIEEHYVAQHKAPLPLDATVELVGRKIQAFNRKSPGRAKPLSRSINFESLYSRLATEKESRVKDTREGKHSEYNALYRKVSYPDVFSDPLEIELPVVSKYLREIMKIDESDARLSDAISIESELHEKYKGKKLVYETCKKFAQEKLSINEETCEANKGFIFSEMRKHPEFKEIHKSSLLAGDDIMGDIYAFIGYLKITELKIIPYSAPMIYY